jgi:hypothetical protein
VRDKVATVWSGASSSLLASSLSHQRTPQIKEEGERELKKRGERWDEEHDPVNAEFVSAN